MTGNAQNCTVEFKFIQPQKPLLVEPASFKMVTSAQGNSLQWQTLSTLNIAGFHLWQAQPYQGNCKNYLELEYSEILRLVDLGNISRLTKQFIEAQSQPFEEALYTYEISNPEDCYVLEEVDFKGNSLFYLLGPDIKGGIQLFH